MGLFGSARYSNGTYLEHSGTEMGRPTQGTSHMAIAAHLFAIESEDSAWTDG
jgi:hypothetical protein